MGKFDSKEYWNRRARRFGKSAKGFQASCLLGMDQRINEYIDALQRKSIFTNFHVEKGMKILDVGCGVGRWSFRFAERGADVTGFDISSEMISLAQDKRTREADPKFYVATTNNLPFIDNYFDAVISVTVLQHIVENKVFLKAINEITRVCKSSGIIILVELATRKLKKGLPHICFRTCKQWIESFPCAELLMKQGVERMPFISWALSLAERYYHLTQKKAESDSFAKISYYETSPLKKVFNNILQISLFLSKLADKFSLLKLSEHYLFIFRKK